ncbi:N-acetylmuramoyl-L-alanine amidase [Candidatus Syntrophocurvum alkaliphilum]|uniref:N-acetylmuramoyl-L-alanine amidase n=1 Tax=Candidatus Syntrophocurvum alkaliphilum TaxID=2293317 RepID=A0A6I6DJ23_9FIRM|nr:N-acetylmuramoyl-L-alanine amidase [Candidatus Syntrophocurvum alkaliphilum]QGU00814.1 N-acetylmuramoyl-L-alanine amidase [Candidatus Syntrophocurvum alkaliphilum]
MRRIEILYFNKKKGAISLATVLLIALCFVGAKMGYQEERMVMEDSAVISYAIANKVIVVDAGHGGVDPGAIRGNIVEKDITLEISKKLTEKLSQAGALVIMTRETETDVIGEEISGKISNRKRKDLARRVEKAEEAKADLFISIHTNADVSSKWRGAQTFYSSGSEISKIYAESIQEEMTRILGNTNRKAKPGSYYVMDKSSMPTVIVEVGFISNPQEAKLLQDDAYQSQVCYSILSGIVKAELQKMQVEEN